MPDAWHPHRSRLLELVASAVAEIEQQLRACVTRYRKDRVGVFVGSSTAGMDVTERAFQEYVTTGALPSDYCFEDRHPYHVTAEVLRSRFDITGPSFVVSTACSSSAKCLGTAQRFIAADLIDAALVVGVDALCEMTLAGFHSLSVLSPKPCRPFDGARQGMNLGEGATAVVLERSPTSDALGYLLGVGETSDAHHPTAPHPEGEGAIRAIFQALAQAGLEPSDVDYINAHGTGTALNDLAESRAIQSAFGSTVQTASTKDRTAHLLGAAGVTETALCLDGLCSGKPAVNAAPTEPASDITIQLGDRRNPRPPRTALSNSFAFGGSNASVLVGLDPTPPEVAPALGPVFLTGIATWSPGFASPSELAMAFGPGNSLPPKEPEADARPPAAWLPARPRGRASPLTRLFAELMGQLMALETGASLDIPTIFASAYGEMNTSVRLLEMLCRDDRQVSPASFQASVHNTAAGVLSIATKNQAFSTSLAAGPDTFAAALLEGVAFVALHGGQALVMSADERGTAPLTYQHDFESLGVGVRLSCEATGGPLGRLSVPTRAATLAETAVAETAVAETAVAGTALAEPVPCPELPPSLKDNPSAGGLPLLLASSSGVSGRVPLGFGGGSLRYSVQFEATK
jgi:3-oxoacyl-[acyl-carrier-protein] synthase-1